MGEGTQSDQEWNEPENEEICVLWGQGSKLEKPKSVIEVKD